MFLFVFSLYKRYKQQQPSGITKEDRDANFNAWLKEKKDIREEEKKLASDRRGGGGGEEDLGYGPNGAEIVRDHQGMFVLVVFESFYHYFIALSVKSLHI